MSSSPKPPQLSLFEIPPEPFTFSVDLGVIDSLGVRLYSNAAAVLTELVANAWDADANEVSIDWNTTRNEIVVQDDGSGMTRAEINSRFLTVAYRRREVQGLTSEKFNRPVMGRKGIGKLSIFSLADEVVVYSRKESQPSGLMINLKELEKGIKSKGEYLPVEVFDFPKDFPEHGTRLVLRKLNKKRTGVSVKALRRRIARRFDVLNYSKEDKDRFFIFVDGERVSHEDREDLKRIEYVWHLGEKRIEDAYMPKLKDQWLIEDVTVGGRKDWQIRGWIGSVGTPDELVDEEDPNESLKNIMVLARRRPIQEGILDKLRITKIFGNYVTGQIEAEFLDEDGADDIATSDRQRLVEDDERVVALIQKLKQIFRRAGSDWEDAHPRQKFEQLKVTYPAVHKWASSRPIEQRKIAEKMIRTVAALQLTQEQDRKNLFKSSILAFERIALDRDLKNLEKLASGVTADDIMPILASSRSYEDGLYLQILRSRLGAIDKLKELISKDELEKVLQAHIFNNMWLLDPAWEGATDDAAMEESLDALRGDLFSKDEKTEMDKGRIDIRYKNAAGVHMIIELKKYGRVVPLDELIAQGKRYFYAMKQVLKRQHSITSKHIQVVFVLGQEPSYKPHDLGDHDTLSEYLEKELGSIHGRVFFYDEMLANARRAYKKYYEKASLAKDLDEVLQSLEEVDAT